MVSEQVYRGTHRHRPPLGWHPPRGAPDTTGTDRDTLPGEPTEPHVPAFTGELTAQRDPVAAPVEEVQPAPARPVVLPGEYQYLKRWTFVCVVAGVWIVSACIGWGLYYWWFHSIDKTPPVFVVLVYLVVAIVASLITAMVQNKPLVSAVAVALMSAPFAAVAAAAVLHGIYFCDRVGRCLVGVIPY
jgi:hypothetical protein